MMIVWHRHHLKPKHAGGTNDKSNIVRVNVAMHAFLHLQLFKQYGRWQDELAWKSLSGLIPSAEVASECNRMRMTGRYVSPETRQRMAMAKLGKTRNSHTEETKRKISDASKGRVGNWKGLTHSEDTKRKMSESALAQRELRSQSMREIAKSRPPEYYQKMVETRKLNKNKG
jgi:hypothetical protein